MQIDNRLFQANMLRSSFVSPACGYLPASRDTFFCGKGKKDNENKNKVESEKKIGEKISKLITAAAIGTTVVGGVDLVYVSAEQAIGHDKIAEITKTTIGSGVPGGSELLYTLERVKHYEPVQGAATFISDRIPNNNEKQKTGWELISLSIILMTLGAIGISKKLKQPSMAIGQVLSLAYAVGLMFNQSALMRSGLPLTTIFNLIGNANNYDNQKNPLNRREGILRK